MEKERGKTLFFFFFDVFMIRDRRVSDALPKLRAWAERFLQPQRPQQTASFDNNAKTPIRINKVLEIEQSIWCPMWGITGKIDMVVQVLGVASVFGFFFERGNSLSGSN
jgi:hypothetical protein